MLTPLNRPCWSQDTLQEQSGVLIAADAAQEWMIPWWWRQYSRENRFPVTLVDFGLSSEMKTWCEEHFTVRSLPPLPWVTTPEYTNPQKRKMWETVYGSTSWQEKRVQWHKKPFAMLQTPYQYTLWLDVDCEVVGPLDPLFIQIQSSSNVWMAQESLLSQAQDALHGQILPGEVMYNSGVVGFLKESKEILTWAEHTLHSHGEFLSDQNLFSRLAFTQGWKVEELDPIYNWRDWCDEDVRSAKIIHWFGQKGKVFISQKILGFL